MKELTRTNLYAQATLALLREFNKLFRALKDILYKSLDISGFHYKNLQFGDSYFLGYRGKNSINEFRIKELPGWLFGLWLYDPVKNKEEKDALDIKCTLFWQWEETIDKFKPSRSVYCFHPVIRYNSKGKFEFFEDSNTFEIGIGNIIDTFVFMYKEPELAFCRDWRGWNYNTQYHTRAEAKKEYLKEMKREEAEKKLTPILNNSIIKLVKSFFKPYLKAGTVILYDYVDCLPRYTIKIKKSAIESFKDLDIKDVMLELILNKEEKNKLNRALKEAENVARKNDFYWTSPLDGWCQFLDDETFTRLSNLSKQDKGEIKH